MELKEKIMFNYNENDYIINKEISEYIIDEPCGGGKSVIYRIQEGMPFIHFKEYKDGCFINTNFLQEIEKHSADKNYNLIIYEYQYNYIWELGFKDYIYYARLKYNKKESIEYSFSDSEKTFKFIPKL